MHGASGYSQNKIFIAKGCGKLCVYPVVHLFLACEIPASIVHSRGLFPLLHEGFYGPQGCAYLGG